MKFIINAVGGDANDSHGTSSLNHFEENLEAVKINLTKEDMDFLA